MIGFPAIFTENMFDKKYVAVLRFFFFCSPRCWGLLAKNKKKKETLVRSKYQAAGERRDLADSYHPGFQSTKLSRAPHTE